MYFSAKHFTISIVVFFLLFFAGSLNSFSAVFDVSNESELQIALSTAGINAEDDVINIAPGTYSTSNNGVGVPFTYDSIENFSLTINGSGNDSTFLDGDNSHLVLDIFAPITTDFDFEINNLTIQNGSGSSAGGLRFEGQGTVTVNNLIFNGNDSTGFGGGASIESGDSTVSFTDTNFLNNTAADDGGGISFTSAGTITITNNDFTNNSVTDDGGAMSFNGDDFNITIINSTFTDNTSVSDQGGALFGIGMNYVYLIQDCNFTNNDAPTNQGGGIFHIGDIMEFTSENSTYMNNDVDDQGGAVFTIGDDHNLTYNNNTFTNNSASGTGSEQGGAVFSIGNNNVSNFNANLFSDNSAGDDGGAVFLLNSTNSTSVFVNNIFLNNTSGNNGGGLTARNDQGLTLTNNTFTLNSSINNGGAVYYVPVDNTTVANLFNNIIFNNTAFGDGDDIAVDDDNNSDNIGAPVNLFNNDFSDFVSMCTVNSPPCVPDVSEGDNINEDPLFVDAAMGNVNLQSDSPAINGGTAAAPNLPTTDFDGNPRIDGPDPDMGALEFIAAVASSGGCTLAKQGSKTSDLSAFMLFFSLFIAGRFIWRSKRSNFRRRF